MQQIKSSARRFQVLADPIRLQIVLLLKDGEYCVGQLAEALKLEQPKISYHLKRMLDEGLITKRVEYTWSYYSLAYDMRTWVNREVDLLDRKELSLGARSN